MIMDKIKLKKQEKTNTGADFMRLVTKIVAMVLCVVLGVGSIAACGKKDNNKEDSHKEDASTQDTEKTELSVADTEAPTDNTEATAAETKSYADQDDSLNNVLEDTEISVQDVCNGRLYIAILTSDHVVGEVSNVLNAMEDSLRVPEDAVELLGGLEDNAYVIKNQAGEISSYKTYSAEVGEILELSPDSIWFEGRMIGNYCFNLEVKSVYYNVYLDGKTLKISDSGEAEGVPLYIERENQPAELFEVRSIQADTNTFALLETNEVYCISTGQWGGIYIHSIPSPAPDAAADAEIFCISANELPLITDVNQIYSVSSWGFNSDYVFYEMIGDSENIHARNRHGEAIDAPDLVFKLPADYTTADVVQVRSAYAGMLIEFSDGSIYKIKESKPEECVLEEELTEFNKNGHILKIVNGTYMVILMDDHRVYEYSF